MLLTSHQAKYIAPDLTLQHAGAGIERLGQALFNASVDLNPHQIEAAVFALRSPVYGAMDGGMTSNTPLLTLRCNTKHTKHRNTI